MPYRYPIYRGNETLLRKQIMDALEDIGVSKIVIGPNDEETVPVDRQMIVYNSLDIQGSLDIEGQVVLI